MEYFSALMGISFPVNSVWKLVSFYLGSLMDKLFENKDSV